MKKLLTVAVISAIAALALVGAASADQAATSSVFLGAHTSFDRTWNWTVTKTDDRNSNVTVAQNEVLSLNYTITVGQGTPPYTDSNWVVGDGIVINGNPPFTVSSLSAVTATATQGATTTNGTVEKCSTDDLFATLVTFPFTGTHLLCHYVTQLPNGSAGTANGAVAFSDSSTQTGSTPFDFTSTYLTPGQPSQFNTTLNVVDSQQGTLGTVTAPLAHPMTFGYSIPLATGTCGSYDIPNTVNLIDPATGQSVAQASDTVHVTVTCPHVNGCTLTQGYWKTHSIYGPAAKADPAWNLLPNGPNTSFFSSGQTWLQVFNTAPAGNPYYILADQYMAAVLNQLNGASSTAAVDAALATAVSFFNKYTPAQAAALSSTNADRKAALAAAITLDNYNNGLIGPGHCSE
jgi:hypothetical protein